MDPSSRVTSFSSYHAIRTFISLTKPGIIFGNAVTATAGFVLASRGYIDPKLFFFTMLGLCLIIASGCVFNNYIDRKADAQMKRTKQRALARELISPQSALLFACVLGLFGIFLLAQYSSFIALSIALFGLFVYVVAYSFLKYHSMYATWIGSIAGAVPPLVGYCAVSRCIDKAAWILFFLIAFWQLPHFFAIAIYRLEEYSAASIPVLPRQKGVQATKIHMLIYIIAFLGVSSTLFLYGYVGLGYLITSGLLGMSWLILCLKGFQCENDTRWARKMFIFSLVVVMGLCIAIPFSVFNICTK